MRIEIKTIFTIETTIPAISRATIVQRSEVGKVSESEVDDIRREIQKLGAQRLIQELTGGDIKSALLGGFALAFHGLYPKWEDHILSGPSFDIHIIHEDGDPPKKYDPNQPDAIDPTVTITDADGKPVE